MSLSALIVFECLLIEELSGKNEEFLSLGKCSAKYYKSVDDINML